MNWQRFRRVWQSGWLRIGEPRLTSRAFLPHEYQSCSSSR
jgi:hypothetical protein